MSAPEHVRLLIIGGGPAGYTAALYAARFGLQPICIEGYDAGGQISRTYLVENYPGVPNGTSGGDLAARIREQAEGFGARMATEDVVSVDLSERPFLVTTYEGSYSADALVVATGSRPRSLELPGENELVGRGIAYCAICDGAFFAGQRVVVVGGGNAALEEALAMARVAAEVTLIHRRSSYRADAAVVSAVRANDKITTMDPYVVEELLQGDEGLTGLRLRNVDTAETCYLPTDGLFIAVGHIPASGQFASWLELDRGGCIVTSPTSTATSMPGVFAAGDVADARYRQAITAAASGCQAAIDADRWLISGVGAEPAEAETAVTH